ncbi:hypothetical protein IPG36_06945 [bacterium]|nr:MAG: hypothetical protein IPG36_06945 [bacterium]
MSEMPENNEQQIFGSLDLQPELLTHHVPPETEPSNIAPQEAITQIDAVGPDSAIDAHQLVDWIVAAEHAPDSDLSIQLEKMRSWRSPGDQYRINQPNKLALDATIIGLVATRHAKLAEKLISSSQQELQNLRFATSLYAERNGLDEAAKLAIEREINSIVQRNRTALLSRMTISSAPEGFAAVVVDRAANPDSAGAISEAQWQLIGQLGSEAQASLLASSRMDRTACGIQDLDTHGLLGDMPILIGRIDQLDDRDQTEAYLTEYGQAVGKLAEMQQSGQELRLPIIKRELAQFAQPDQALAASEAIYGDLPLDVATSKLADLFRDPAHQQDLVPVDPQILAQLTMARVRFDDLGVLDDLLPPLLDRIRDSTDQPQLVEDILTAVAAAQALKGERLLYLDPVIQTDHPAELAASLAKVTGLAEPMNDPTRAELLRAITDAPSAPQAVDMLQSCSQALASRSLKFDSESDITISDMLRQLSPVAEQVSEADPQVRADRLSQAAERIASNYLVAREITDIYNKNYGEAISLAKGRRAVLSDCPEIARRMADIGCSGDDANRMFSTWSYHSEYAMASYARAQRGEGKVTLNMLPALVNLQRQHIEKNLRSYEDYVARFGSEEAREIMTMFKITNFEHVGVDLLHDQLERWRSGERPVENLMIVSRADWNGANSNAGQDTQEVFKDTNFFVFEAGSARDLDDIRRAVKDRELSHGRVPKEENAVKNVVIHAHANPDGILLGLDGEAINVGQYLKLQKLPNARARTYEEELGSAYRIIIQACSTKGENTSRFLIGADGRLVPGPNIAATIHEYHQRTVESSPVPTVGNIVTDENDKVWFGIAGGYLESTPYEKV